MKIDQICFFCGRYILFLTSSSNYLNLDNACECFNEILDNSAQIRKHNKYTSDEIYLSCEQMQDKMFEIKIMNRQKYSFNQLFSFIHDKPPYQAKEYINEIVNKIVKNIAFS